MERMKDRKTAFAAGLLLACLLVAGEWTPPVLAARDIAGGLERGMRVSRFGLASLDGLEVLSIKVDGSDPVKTKTAVVTYRGRRAVRIVNEDGLTATGGPADGQAIAINLDIEPVEKPDTVLWIDPIHRG